MLKPVTCDQCQWARINGVFCHETGCPNQGKIWEDGEWVKYHECYICGCDVKLGDNCDCQDVDNEPESRDDDESDDRNYCSELWEGGSR